MAGATVNTMLRRRHLLAAPLLWPCAQTAHAGAQVEEPLADSVRSALTAAIAAAAPPRPAFARIDDRMAFLRWQGATSERLNSLQSAVEDLALSRFIGGDASNLSLLGGLSGPTEQVEADVLAEVANNTSVSSIDEYEAVRADRGRGHLRADALERRVGRLEGERHLVVLRPSEGAGRVDERAARPDVARRRREDPELERGQRGEPGGIEAPAEVGAAAERAQLRARGVHEDAVGDEVRWRRGAVHADDAGGTRTGGPRPEPREPLPVGVGRVDAPARADVGGEEERLPARPRAGVEDRLAGTRADRSAEELAPLVLDLEEAVAVGREPADVRAG